MSSSFKERSQTAFKMKNSITESLEEMRAWLLQGIVSNRCDIYSTIILALGIVTTNSKIISNNNA